MKLVKYLFVVMLLLPAILTNAQSTTAIGMHIGLGSVYYKNTIPGNKSFYTVFLPHFNAEVKRSSENLFYGSLGFGIVPRRIAFLEFQNGDKIGIEAPEVYGFVKAGIQARSSFLTHMPFISLGIGKLADGRSYYSSNKVVTSIDTLNYKNYFQYKPYFEIGNTMINSTYVEDKRNILLTLSIRYYPTNLFKIPVPYQYDFNTIGQAQYQMFEFILAMGIQHNFHKQ